MIFVRVMAKMPLDGNAATILGTVCELTLKYSRLCRRRCMSSPCVRWAHKVIVALSFHATCARREPIRTGISCRVV